MFTIEFFRQPEGIVLTIFTAFTLIQLFYYWYYFARPSFAKNNAKSGSELYPPVSVIICAKNEYENLKNN
ncbi:MAG: hypothetical protein ACOC12_01480, partial [Bacteroidota bacterium]